MASDEAQTEDLLDRLILQMKAVSLLYGTEGELREKLGGRLAGSHDEGVKRFVAAVQREQPEGSGKLLAVALGELVMAGLLVVAGTIVLVPTVTGVNTLAGLVQYFEERASGVVGASPLSQYLPFGEFVVGVLLVLTAFFALREAAAHLKKAGLAVKSGES